MQPPLLSKSEQRKQLRGRRRALSDVEQQHAAGRLAERMQQTQWYQNAKHIAAYLPSDGEISLLPLMARAWASGKATYLPRVEGREMRFVAYGEGDVLQANRFGIEEPLATAKVCPRAMLDLVLLPMVGFDHLGNRLGMGGGFYDRYFEGVREQGRTRPVLIGVAHSDQELDRVAADPWDIALDAVITENDTRYFSA